jgi:hypothetical protein
MIFPIDPWDITLLVAVISLLLLVTNEFLSISHGRINILINKKKLTRTATATSILFIITVAIRVIAVIYEL